MNIGLLFGSFNPVHVGHLIIASHMQEYGNLEKVLFVLSPQNPFKKEASLLPEEQRLKMLETTIKDDPRFEVSTLEFELPRPSYTINTLRYLKRIHPEDEFTLIMGSDNLESFHLWKEHEEILSNFKIYTYPRSGFQNSKYFDHPSVKTFNAPLLDISATFIREAVSSGRSIRYLITDAAIGLIKKNSWYGK